jgi:hypothetical protein
VDHVRFLAQSNRVPAAELAARTDAFLASFARELAAMPAARFAANVDAVVAKKLDGDKSLRETASRLWSELRDGMMDFSRASDDVAALRATTQAQLVAWWDAHVGLGGARRRALVSLVEAGADAASGADDGHERDDEGGDDDEEDGEEEEEEEEEDVVVGGVAAVAAAAAAAAAVDDVAGGETAVRGGGGGATDGGASPTIVAGGVAPTEGGLAREDVLVAPAPAAVTEAAPLPAPLPPSVTLRLTLEQAAAVQYAVDTHVHLQWPSDAATAVVVAALGGDAGRLLADALAATGGEGGAAPPPPAFVRACVDVPSVAALRTLLPLLPDVGAMRTAAWRARSAGAGAAPVSA